MRKALVAISFVVALLLTSCSITRESSINVNINGKNVIDAKAEFNTNNPDLITLDVNTSEFQRVNFGTMNGKPISWYVIYDEGNKQILLSEEILDTKRYNETKEIKSWGDTTLHEYLNTDFVNTYFSKEELDRILFTNDVDSDVVTMLSINDLIDLYGDQYYLYGEFYNDKDDFLANKKIVAKPSEQALYNEIDVFDNEVYAKVMQENTIDERYNFANGNSGYWLLNQVEGEPKAYIVTSVGLINQLEVDTDYIGIRPVIRIKK